MSKVLARRNLQLKREISIKRIDECLAAGLQAKVDSSRLPLFMSRFSKIDGYCSSFETHHLKLISEITDVNELDQEDVVRQEFDDKYFQIIEIHTSLSTATTIEGETNRTDLSVKLPRLNLVHFDGNIKSWGTFYDMFNTMVHQNKRLSNIERFSILISLLSGEPLQLLKGFPLSDSNYLDAYAALIDRYNNKRKLAFRHWEEIQNASLKSNSPSELRRLVDTFRENIAVLKNLRFPVNDWDFPLFYLLINKLDQDTRRRFELQNDNKDVPSFESLLEYVSKAGQALELADLTECAAAPAARAPTAPGRTARAHAAPRTAAWRPAQDRAPAGAAYKTLVTTSATSIESYCVLCKSNHDLAKCVEYRNKTPHERFSVVKDNRLCVNCLRSGHVVKTCPSKSRCLKCNVAHHTTIHFDVDSGNSKVSVASSASTNAGAATCSSSSPLDTPMHVPDKQVTMLASDPTPVGRISLFATACVEVLDKFGSYQKIRIVIDNCSQPNLITRRCAQRLGLPIRQKNTSIEGVCEVSTLSTSYTTLNIRSMKSDFEMCVEAFVTPKICSDQPAVKIDMDQLSCVKAFELADSNFDKPGCIDALLGVDVFCQIFLGNRHNCDDGPTIFETKLGWVIMGKAPCATSHSQTSLFCSIESLDTQIRKFWEIESLPNSSPLTDDEVMCEKIFASTHARDSNGRYIVHLPFRTVDPRFGDSRALAERRLLSLEKRLAREPELRTEYNNFMRDYLDAGHMEPVAPQSDGRAYYLAHFCVLKPSSTTTKLRAVFDATAQPTGGPSLNDQLLVGPKLQSDLVSILLRFRLHAVVFTADIRQMYRQILVSLTDRDFQRILFRFSLDEPIQEFRLNTVTYGMSSSSFLAIRALIQLAIDEGKKYPRAVDVLKRDIYVDDVVTGAESVESALDLQSQVVQILEKGCFELRKWSSNCPRLLDNLDPTHCHNKTLSFDSEPTSPVKVLGMEWNPSSDAFTFTVNALHEKCTKRNILSELARIFDPLGFLTPLTLSFKRIIQELWTLGLDWDVVAPPNISQNWFRYRLDLDLLSSLEIPRFIPSTKSCSVQLHGFCDASEAGYSAVIYFRIRHSDGSITIHLIMSRCKVSPLQRTSTPRLELCAAVLLTDLVKHVKEIYNGDVQFEDIFCWSDSTVTLSWLRSPSQRWKTYVSNRVSHIQERIPAGHWRHVTSETNPADCASRGVTVRELVNHPLWWTGPAWLALDSSSWPKLPSSIEPQSDLLEEQRVPKQTVLFTAVNQLDDFLSRHSSLNKAKRIVAYVHRFVHNCRNPDKRRFGPLVQSELDGALTNLVKLTQDKSFSNEIISLKEGKKLPKQFRKLSVFIDNSGLLRVGGRLVHSELDYDCKHPLLLPSQDRMTQLVIDQVHNDSQHPGLRTLNFLIAQNFWILASKRVISSRLSKCIKCFRSNPKPLVPRMADLPKTRISQVKPFSCIGVDFAGPFPTYIKRYRGARPFKTHVCLFICFATKASHVELVIGLTTEAFLAALRRFIARRGRCQRIHCDRGTNFVGAYNALLPLMQDAASRESIEFSFNPPAAPHFGGLWEANIKSFKTHLARVVGNQILTYEEFLTVAAQIESALNSRPLCEMSSDPNDMSVLTPGHFLTLEPLTSLVDTSTSDINISISNRWQLVQKLHRDFWKRWHLEYLHTLNQRAKWHSDIDKPKVGTLVLIKDEQLKPLHWSLGRIVSLHPGKDGIPRVATVRSQSGLIQRPLVKLCPLPID